MRAEIQWPLFFCRQRISFLINSTIHTSFCCMTLPVIQVRCIIYSQQKLCDTSISSTSWHHNSDLTFTGKKGEMEMTKHIGNNFKLA